MTPAKKPKLKPSREPWNSMELVALAAFLIWCGAGLYSTINHVTPETVKKWLLPEALHNFVLWCLANGDPILIVLAFINTHLHAARQWASGAARRWAFTVLVFAYLIEFVGVKTGIPFGDYHYTTNFGPMLWLVPLTIPLAWHVIVTNALFVVRAVNPHASQWVEALLGGAICTVYDVILEPFATTVKHYWNWVDPTVPPTNYISWFVISAFLIRFLSPTLSTRYRFDPRPWLILALTIAIFIAGEMR